MNRLLVKDWVCLVDAEEIGALIQARQERARQQGDHFSGKLRERLWRQIEITATPEKVQLSMMNVDHEAARGGYWNGGENCVSHSFTWDDLRDVEFVDSMLCREQVVVYRRALTMLTTLKARVAVLREALQAI